MDVVRKSGDETHTDDDARVVGDDVVAVRNSNVNDNNDVYSRSTVASNTYRTPPSHLDLRRVDDDAARFSRQHARVAAVAGVGFLSDAYDVFVVGLALPMLYRVYYPPEGNSTYDASTYASQHPNIDALLKAATSWGNLVGQLLFGYLGDVLGRRRVYGAEMLVMIVAIAGSTLAASTVRGVGVRAMLGFWRFVLGLGVGGDYPLSASIAAEFSYPRFRGRMVAGVFSMQGVGILLGAIAAVVLLAAFQTRIRQDPLYLDYVWRFLLGLGLLPCVLTVYSRLTLPETPHYSNVASNEADNHAQVDDSEVEKAKVASMTVPIPMSLPNSSLSNVDIGSGDNIATEDTITTSSVHVRDRANSSVRTISSIPTSLNPSHDGSILSTETTAQISPKPILPSFKHYFSEWRNFKILLGTSYCWFALDVAWYGLSLNNQVVLTLAGYAPTNVTQYESFFQKAVGNIIIALMGTVPGYYITVLLIDKWGRLPIQKLGFLVISACLFIMAGTWNQISKSKVGFMAIYTVAQLFFNFGPNVTTFVIPSEVFPTHLRSRAHGISAAVGKAGAIIGVQAIGPHFFSNVQATMFAFGAIMLSGFFATYLLPEMKQKPLEIWDQFDEHGRRIKVDKEID